LRGRSGGNGFKLKGNGFKQARGFKLKQGRFTSDIQKKFLTLRVVRHWHRLPREAVDAPSLKVFKARLDGAWSNLVWWKVSLAHGMGAGLGDLSGPFQPK